MSKLSKSRSNCAVLPAKFKGSNVVAADCCAYRHGKGAWMPGLTDQLAEASRCMHDSSKQSEHLSMVSRDSEKPSSI